MVFNVFRALDRNIQTIQNEPTCAKSHLHIKEHIKINQPQLYRYDIEKSSRCNIFPREPHRHRCNPLMHQLAVKVKMCTGGTTVT